jgi:nucleotide-binding universal stress UspA family protein
MAPGNGRGLRVLWATDSSDESRVAVAKLRRLILPATERLTVLSVAPHSFISGARPDPAFLTRITPGARRRALLEAEDVAQQALTDLDPSSIEVEAISRWGNAIEEILRASRGARSDLIVMGAKGHSNLELIVQGSVSQGVVQNCSRPVLGLRPGQDRFLTVLIGYDGSLRARRAVQFLERFSLPLNVTFRFVYVVEPVGPPHGATSAFRRRAMEEAEKINHQRHIDAERALKSLADQIRASKRNVETDVLSGAAGPNLDDAARTSRADLSVVGSRKPSPESHYLLGTTAENLVRHSRTSVLVVR